MNIRNFEFIYENFVTLNSLMKIFVTLGKLFVTLRIICDKGKLECRDSKNIRKLYYIDRII